MTDRDVLPTAVLTGRFAEAEEHLRRALDLEPLGTAVRFNAAICRFYAGRYEPARLEWERHPEIPRATLSAAWALMLEGRNAEALERFRNVFDDVERVRRIEAAGGCVLDEIEKLVRAIELFALGVAGFALHLAWQVRTIDIGNPAKCLYLFRSNREAGLILFAGIVLDALTGSPGAIFTPAR